MKLTLATELNTDAKKVWDAITSPAFLAQVSEPVLSFDAMNDQVVPEKWKTGSTLTLKIRVATVLPVGNHTIRCVRIDDEHRVLETSESGSIANTWNHIITVTPLGAERTLYTDQLHINAGLLTIHVWSFAHLLYRFRQQRIKQLLEG